MLHTNKVNLLVLGNEREEMYFWPIATEIPSFLIVRGHLCLQTDYKHFLIYTLGFFFNGEKVDVNYIFIRL